MSVIIVFDTETTGVGAKDQVLELASVVIMNGEIVDKKRWQANPGVPINPKASETHGFYDDDVKHFPPISEVAQAWLEWVIRVNNKFPVTLCAHNAAFDLRMLAKQIPEIHSFPVLCTLRLARRELPLAPKHTVSSLYTQFGHDLEAMNAHTALDDCLMTTAVLQGLLKIAQRSVQDLVEEQRNPQPLKITPIGGQKGKKFSELTDSHIIYFSKLDDLDPDLHCTIRNEMQVRGLIH